VYDWPRLFSVLRTADGWVFMRNRNDAITVNPDGPGVQCNWEFSRTLHLCNLFPGASRILLKRALKQWPVQISGSVSTERMAAAPQVSFIIGHRGLERLPHLLLTLKSIERQAGAEIECIVVEQDREPLIRDRLPSWVRYRHAPLSATDAPYNRSAALNAGARLANGDLLILHDGDLLVPAAYAAEVFRLGKAGYDIMEFKRFVFYAECHSTRALLADELRPQDAALERVVENLCGGGTVAISKQAFWTLGGMDEEFIGWGGEDNEFWDRCLTRKSWAYQYLPFLHLWHPSLADRRTDSPGLSLLAQKRQIPMMDRIQRLCARQ
jgi:hypothetical protein